jgi:hypothetical protein
LGIPEGFTRDVFGLIALDGLDFAIAVFWHF